MRQDLPFHVVGSVWSDTGCRRELNEDTGLFLQPDPALAASKGALAIVADGMGGHAAGEVASRLAVETIGREYYASDADPPAALAAALRVANRRIFEYAARESTAAGMGTTCTALAIVGRAAYCAHVGDSRVYLVREGTVQLMTEDHSLVQDLVNRGVITPAEARRHSDRNVILRALGTHERVEVASWASGFPLCTGDTFVVCSDGLHDLVDAVEVGEIAGSRDPAEASRTLVDLARARGGFDNITVVVARVMQSGDGGPAAG